ncbi:MAG: hypothetical protein KGL39_34820 [Patescibacteria group bacterium]|nr:hypothetical protein [Patescibacteria group bacterium]
MKEPLTPDQVRTAWLIVLLFVMVVGVDAWLWWSCDAEATISRTMTKIGQRWPAFPVFVGMAGGYLLGHWFG